MNNLLWSRREILKTASVAAIGYPAMNFISCTKSSPVAEPVAAIQLLVPDWIAPGKLRWVWALWEPMDLMRRGGSAAGIGDGRATGHWVIKWYERMHTDEILDKLADIGVNLVSTHFYKGFGLKAEAEEMERAADYTKRAHARGIRVLGYHQFSTVIYETMMDEFPNLKDWIQRGPDGSLRTYGGGGIYWRWMACPIHDDFMAYLRKVIDHTLLHADMDGVEYDGTAYDCHCDKCQEAFRKYLTANNPDPRERFGLPHFNNALIPKVFNVRDPLWQEWVRFRIDLMGNRLREMRAYVHKIKPGAALVTYEDCAALWRRDRTRGLPDSGDYLDLAIAESHDMPQMLKGELVTKVRHLKEGTSINQVALSTDWLKTESGGIMLPTDTKPVELDMAENLACGGHVLTATWALRSGDKRDGSAFFEQPAFYNAMKLFMQFGKKNEHLHESAKPCANVWVYHSQWSLAFDHRNAYNSVLGFEQALLGRMAYRVAKEAHLGGLTDRDVLIVANQTCLSQKECDAIRTAVSRGCGVIITGNTSAYDENYRQHLKPALTDLYDKPNVHYFQDCPGRSSRADATGGLTPAMPARYAEILQAVRDLAKAGLAAELQGGEDKQPKLFVDVYQQPGGCVVHVVNYGDDFPKGLKFRPAAWLIKGEPVLYSPYLPEPLKLERSADGWISLPSSMVRYGAVKFS